MWKLKVGDAEGGNPLLHSLNNFAGRLTWEYDANAGSKSEREFVERARKQFTINRDQQQHSADVLYRTQYGGQQETKRRKIASVRPSDLSASYAQEVCSEVHLRAQRTLY